MTKVRRKPALPSFPGQSTLWHGFCKGQPSVRTSTPGKETEIMVTLIRRSLAVLAFTSAISFGASAHDTASAASPAKQVRLGYFANVTHAQAVLGVASGEFQKALPDSKLTTKTFNAGPSLVEALFAGEIDIGYVGPSPAINAYVKSRGEGIRVIAGAAANGVVIVAGPKSGIKTMADLKGKRIATPQLGNTQDVSARHYVTNTLGQSSTDNILAVPNAEQVAMMTRGQIDAAWAVEPWGARLVAEAGGTIIGQEKDLWEGGEFVLTLVVVSPEFLAEHPAEVEAILGVHRSWTARLVADAPAQAAALADGLTGLTGKAMSKEIVSDAISRVKFTDEPLESTLQTFAQWAYDLGFAKESPAINGLVDPTFLRKVQGQPASQPAPAGGR
jgi:NitT/TauT family transport system substrate-binding protein